MNAGRAIALIIAGLMPVSALVAADPTAERFFEESIRPVLAKNCYACHSQQSPKAQGGLRLDSPESILAGGNAGSLITAGKPERSLLMRVLSHEGAVKMPPTGKLAAVDVAAVERWIRMGAPMPAAVDPAKLAKGEVERHWAFRRPGRPEPPPKISDWALTSIDRFVEAGLQAQGLTPSDEADRRTLIRRAYFDLIGIPPPPDDVRAFVNDSSAEAYGAVVDRLLASKHFGERWARHWLDVARYSDEGFQARPFQISWTYRDWVIDAFNSDMPYDRFITRQIAADLTGDEPEHLAALGFLTVGINLPRPTDVPENLDDRIDVVTRGFLGLSVSCARCHDHKFDPIPQKDYYSIYSIFLNSPDVLEPVAIDAVPDEQNARFFKEKLRMRREWLDTFQRERLDWHIVEFRKRDALERYITTAWQARNSSNRELEALGKEHNLNQYLLERWHRLLVDLADKNDPIVSGLDGKYGIKELALQLAAADRETGWPDAERESLRQVLRAPDAPTNIPFEDFWWIQNEGDSNVMKALKWQYNAVMTDWSYRGGPRHAMTVTDGAESRPAYVFVRGNQHDKGARVDPHFVSVISSEPFQMGSGRLELARAIASTDNPLTARVMVNRVWQHLFGEGLVRTPSDFGTRGGEPSHPALLDHLATTFVDDGWSIKKLIRRVMLSRVYRQKSGDSPDCELIDPTNRLLWRQKRRRMEFEVLRDSMLAAAGRLDTSVGGPPFALEARPASPRRSIYAYISREEPSGLMRSFDFSNPEQHTEQRSLTTVPQQALFLMNSAFVGEQARAIAATLEGSDTAQKARALYQRLFGRDPSAGELQAAEKFVREHPGAPEIEPPPEEPWRYGTVTLDPAEGVLRDFQEFEYRQGERLQRGTILPTPEGGRASLTARGGAPGDDLSSAVTRRWVSPIDGRVSISGTLNHPLSDQGQRFSYSNGIRGWVVSSRTGAIGSWTITGIQAATDFERLKVERGETIDFVVDSRGDYESDNFTWAPIVEQMLSGDQKKSGMKAKRWSAVEDFRFPAEKPLGAWEQYAQVLLMTNEFAFVD